MSRAADVLQAALEVLIQERDRLSLAIDAISGVLATGGPNAPLKIPGLVPPATRSAATKAPAKPGQTGTPAAPQTKSENRKSPAAAPRGKLAGRVAEIRKLWDAGLTMEVIAGKIGCSAEAIRLMAKAHRWERPPAAAVTRLAPGVSRRPEEEL